MDNKIRSHPGSFLSSPPVHLCSAHVSHVALWFTEGRCYSNFREKEIDTEASGWPARDYLIVNSEARTFHWIAGAAFSLSHMLCWAHPKTDSVTMTVETAAILVD